MKRTTTNFSIPKDETRPSRRVAEQHSNADLLYILGLLLVVALLSGCDATISLAPPAGISIRVVPIVPPYPSATTQPGRVK